MASYAPSFLDKLLGIGSTGREGTAPRRSVEQVKDSVARDIEMLLNAHQAFTPAELRDHPNASRSLLTLGLVDIASMSLASDPDRARITDAIRESLSSHDKRLADVQVGLRPSGSSSSSPTFTIRARLILDPDVERVVFDAVLQPGSNRYAVSQAENRSGSTAT